MSVTQELDLLMNGLGFGALVWLSAATVRRWIQTGRIEAYTVEALLPKALPSWVRWLVAPSFVVTPAPSSTASDPRKSWTITRWGWLYVSGIALWLLIKAVRVSY